MRIPILMVAACLTVAARAEASTIYSYTGNSFSGFFGVDACPPVCNLSGSFVVSSPLAAGLSLGPNLTTLWYSFSNGTDVFTPFNSTAFAFNVSTDASGSINEWNIQMIATATSTYLETWNTPSGFNHTDTPSSGTSELISLVGNGAHITVADWTFVYGVVCAGGAASCPVGMAINTNLPGTWTSGQTDFVPPPIPPQTVPEPSTGMLLFGGSLGLLLVLRQHRQRRRATTVQ